MRSLRQILPSPGALFAFEAAARRGSFTLAGEELGMSQAAVSYAIKQLEGALGTALFLRRHRGVELTEAGERFYNDVSIGLAYIRRSAESLERLRADDHVTLSVSTAFASYWMLPRLVAFRRDLPDIDLRLQTSDKDVDLAAEGIPLGIRRGDGLWAEYESGLLAPEEIWALASPGYLAAAGRPADLDGLARHRLIHLEEPFRPRPTWSDWFEALGVRYHDDGEGLRLNDYALALQAALEGQGVTLGWRHVTAGLVSSGLLVRVVPEAYDSGYGFYLAWPRSRRLSRNAERVRDWLLAQPD